MLLKFLLSFRLGKCASVKYVELSWDFVGEGTQHHYSHRSNSKASRHPKRGEVLESGHQRLCHL